MERGRLCAIPPQPGDLWGGEETTGLRVEVWRVAGMLAVREHRGVVADDLRHGCHWAALGEDRSSVKLRNGELDRVLCVFRLMADAEDLGAMMDWLHPEKDEARRMRWWIEHRCNVGYVGRLSRDIYGTDDWQGLGIDDLRSLFRMLRQRPGAMVASERGREIPQPF